MIRIEMSLYTAMDNYNGNIEVNQVILKCIKDIVTEQVNNLLETKKQMNLPGECMDLINQYTIVLNNCDVLSRDLFNAEKESKLRKSIEDLKQIESIALSTLNQIFKKLLNI